MRTIGLASCLLLTLPVLAQDDKTRPKQTSAEEEKRAYAWFDTLGFPDLHKCKLVRVATGDTDHGRKRAHDKHQLAFLVNDDGQEFTVFTLDLETHGYIRTPEDTPETLRVGYEQGDLKTEAEAAAKCLRESNAWEALAPFGTRCRQSKELFVLARACAAHGHAELAHELFATVESNRGKSGPASVQQQVSDEIAAELLQKANKALADPEVSRKELLARFEAIVEKYPQGSHVQDEKSSRRFRDRLGHHAKPARQAADLLRQMVAEDAAHARLPAKAERDMTKEENIAELIFQLRDQQGSQWFDGCGCDIFDAFGLGGLPVETPALKLVFFEYDAVPQLIAVLNDKRYTKASGYCDRRVRDKYILRVGDCAYQILERIAGRRFRRSQRALADDDDSEAAARKMLVEAWWKEFQTKGEKQMLIEGVEAGDPDSPEQATRLSLRYWNDAFDAIARGIRKAQEEGPRSSLITHLDRFREERALPLLRAELKGPFLGSRVAAARMLQQMRCDEGVDAMIAEWRERLTKRHEDEDCDVLIEFLAYCKRLDAIQALAAELRKRPIRVRFHVIDAFDENRWDRLDCSNVILLGAIECLLVEGLEDTEANRNLTLGINGKNIEAPRTCDVAGHVLSRFWNAPEAFDLSGSLKVRDRQRVAMLNAWRAPRGLPTLPLPPREED